MTEEQAYPSSGETKGRKPFNPQPYIMKLKGKDYLPVPPRVAWFRHDCPIEERWGIVTECIAGSLAEGFATFRAQIWHGDDVIATGHKTEDKAGFPDFYEKAETGAIGRALALCGFGTLFATELDEGTERLVDSPQGNGSTPPAASRQQPAAAGAQLCTICQKSVTNARAGYCKSKNLAITHPECEKK